MRYSFESLVAFHQVVLTGSFSTAARKLNKSQSTISSLIANLEADSGVKIFERNAKGVILTEEGKRLLPYVKDLLSTADNLENFSTRLTETTEPSITIILTESYYLPKHDSLLNKFEQRFPNVILECLVAEEEDVLHLIQTNRAALALVKSHKQYPDDILSCRMNADAELGIFVNTDHPILKKNYTHLFQLDEYRQLKYGTQILKNNNFFSKKIWFSSSYSILIDMVELGFGWSILPTHLVELYNSNRIIQLKLDGWPELHKVDVIWSKNNPLGVVGKWGLEHLLKNTFTHPD